MASAMSACAAREIGCSVVKVRTVIASAITRKTSLLSPQVSQDVLVVASGIIESISEDGKPIGMQLGNW
jgi:hypothetical protein